jgi:hypothetical protein
MSSVCLTARATVLKITMSALINRGILDPAGSL